MSLNITYYQDNEARTTAVLNRPIAQLASFIESLFGAVSSGGSAGHMSVSGVPVQAGVSVGDIVALDAGEARKAIAIWGTQGQDGRVTPSPLARPIGIVSAVDGTTATIITKGLVTDASILAALDGAVEDGDYYLSDTTAGNVASSAPYLPVRVFSIAGGQLILDIAQPPHDLHIHSSYLLETTTQAWPSSVSGDYAYAYAGSQLGPLMALPALDAVVTVNGVVDETNYLFDVTGGAVTLRAKARPSEGQIIRAYATIPYTRDLPVVRAITTAGSGRLQARDTNGVVTITLDGPVPEGTPATDASTAIHNYTATGTPIITNSVARVVGGANITAVTDGNGVCTLSSGYTAGTPVTPQVIDLDGVSAVSTGGELYYYFPGSGTPSVLGVIPVVAPASGQQYKVYPFVLATSKVAVFSGVTLRAYIRFVPYPAITAFGTPATATVDHTHSSVVDIAFPSVGVSSDQVSIITTASSTTVTTGGILHVRVVKESGSAAYLGSFGIVVAPEAIE